MQWPDAAAGAGGAAEAKARQTGSKALGVVEQGIGAIATLFNSASVPGGLDLPCTEDPELFFAEAPEDVETAKALCQGCRARAACLEGALERREPWGVWGGELLLRGTVVPRKRPRGRPRKDDAAMTKAGNDQAALHSRRGCVQNPEIATFSTAAAIDGGLCHRSHRGSGGRPPGQHNAHDAEDKDVPL